MNETPDFFSDLGGTLVANKHSGKPEPQGVLVPVEDRSSANTFSTNLPVPVLAEPNTSRTLLREAGVGEARESTIKHALRAETSNGLRRVVTTGDSRGAQNTLSASVRDRTAQYATALDAKTLEDKRGGRTVTRHGQNIRPHIFGGETFVPRLDEARLTGQLRRVRDLMSDGLWRSLSEIAEKAECSEASASARLRDLRKPKFGFFTVDRKRIGPGLFSYRLGGKGL